MHREMYKFVRDDNGNGWILNFNNDLKYPLFGHPEINENSTQDELKRVCEEIDKEVAKNG